MFLDNCNVRITKVALIINLIKYDYKNHKYVFQSNECIEISSFSEVICNFCLLLIDISFFFLFQE